MGPHLPADPLSAAAPPARDTGSAPREFEPVAWRPASAPGPSMDARRDARAGLYVHVPFCARRCGYCDFATGTLSAHAVERYLSSMALEVARRAPAARGTAFSSVFFGGGTPSALPARAFARLWELIAGAFTLEPDAEITLEANPESVRAGLLDAWRAAGVNRLSMGAQSFDPEELVTLERIHDAARPGQALALARRHGFERISLDLIFGFPGNTEERWRATLARAIELDPEHVSAYCFIPEPGTPLGDAALRGDLPRDRALPDPDTQAAMYEEASGRLESAGYACYETSNFARPRAEARHNLVYWLARPYVGLGPSAHGFANGTRYGNHRSFSRWATELERGRPVEAERETCSADARAAEIVMLTLRLGTGLDRADHAASAWRHVLARYGAALESAVRAGRLERTQGGYRIPSALRFVADDVVAWIEARTRRVQAVDQCRGGPLT